MTRSKGGKRLRNRGNTEEKKDNALKDNMEYEFRGPYGADKVFRKETLESMPEAGKPWTLFSN